MTKITINTVIPHPEKVTVEYRSNAALKPNPMPHNGWYSSLEHYNREHIANARALVIHTPCAISEQLTVTSEEKQVVEHLRKITKSSASTNFVKERFNPLKNMQGWAVTPNPLNTCARVFVKKLDRKNVLFAIESGAWASEAHLLRCRKAMLMISAKKEASLYLKEPLKKALERLSVPAYDIPDSATDVVEKFYSSVVEMIERHNQSAMRARAQRS